VFVETARLELFHVKQLRESYLNSVLAWNKIHRIIGREHDFATRIKESEHALSTLLPATPHIVDIGAGSGLLGIPWLWLQEQGNVVLVEPDAKKSSFLLQFVAQNGLSERLSILPQTFETVSRETLDRLCPPPRAFVTRAFAGFKDFDQVKGESAFSKEDFFVFELNAASKSSRAMLKKISI